MDVQVSLEEVVRELQEMGHGHLVAHAVDRCVNRRLTARIAELEAAQAPDEPGGRAEP